MPSSDPLLSRVRRYSRSAQISRSVSRVIEDLELPRTRHRRRQIERGEPSCHLFRRRRRQPRLCEHRAQWIDVASRRGSPRERRFDDRRAASHERVVHDVAGGGEAVDEEARQLRLEARAIRHLVEAVRGALLARPEFVDERLDDDRPRFGEADAGDRALRGPAIPSERAQLADNLGLLRCRVRGGAGGRSPPIYRQNPAEVQRRSSRWRRRSSE